MYDLLLMFFSLFSQSYFSFLVSFMLSYIFWAFHIVFCLPVQCNLCDVAPGAQAFFCSQFLPQKVMHISVIITYLRFDPSFFRSRSFYASQNHICFHRQLTLLSFIWREMKIVVWNTFSSLCLIFFYFPFYNLFFLCWHKLPLFFHIHFQINATKAYLFYNLLRIV